MPHKPAKSLRAEIDSKFHLSLPGHTNQNVLQIRQGSISVQWFYLVSAKSFLIFSDALIYR